MNETQKQINTLIPNDGTDQVLRDMASETVPPFLKNGPLEGLGDETSFPKPTGPAPDPRDRRAEHGADRAMAEGKWEAWKQ